MDIGDYIYVIILVLAFVISAISKARKKRTRQTPQPDSGPAEPGKQEGLDFETILEQVLKGKTVEEAIPETEPVDITQQIPAEVSLDTSEDYHFGTDEGIGNASLRHDDSHYILPSQQERSAIDFDLRQAIIYNVILQRPEY